MSGCKMFKLCLSIFGHKMFSFLSSFHTLNYHNHTLQTGSRENLCGKPVIYSLKNAQWTKHFQYISSEKNFIVCCVSLALRSKPLVIKPWYFKYHKISNRKLYEKFKYAYSY